MTPPLLATLLASSLLLLGAFGLALRRRARTLLWGAVARSLRLKRHRKSPLAPPVVSGTLGGVEIRLRDLGGGSRPAVEAVATCALPEGLTLQRQGALEGLRQRVAGKDLQVGDAPFDDGLLITGSHSAALAVLSAPARKALTKLAAGDGFLEVSLGAVHLTRGGIGHDPRAIIAFAEGTARLARALQLPRGGVSEGLRIRALTDPVATVQIRALEALVDGFPKSSDCARAVQGMLASPEPAVVAAGRRALLQTSESPDAELLRDLLRSPRPADRIVALEAIGRSGLTDWTAAAREQLTHAEQAVRLAACEALAAVATPDAIPALRAAASGFLAPASMVRASERAVAAILARTEGAARGAIALHEDGEAGAGALSSVQDGELAEAAPSGRRVPAKSRGQDR